MPRNQFQRAIFALLAVIVTVHAYVFYSLYVVNGSTLLEFYIKFYGAAAFCVSSVFYLLFSESRYISASSLDLKITISLPLPYCSSSKYIFGS